MKRGLVFLSFSLVLFVFLTLSRPYREAAATDTRAQGQTKINPINGAEMVWIPGGEFLMGWDKEDIDAAWKRFGWK